MKLFVKHNVLYILFFLISLGFVATILLNTGKVQIHKAINTHVGNAFADTFFKYITHLGDGVFVILVVIGLLFFNVRKALYVLMSYIGAAILSTIIKRFVYPDEFRPHSTFQYFVREKLNLVEGVNVLSNNSFPSGHSAAAFSLFFCLLFMSKNHLWKSLFFGLAFIIAFSRTYISQHWLVDIYFGAIIGFSFSLFCYIIFYSKQHSKKYNITLPQLISKNKRV